MIELYILKRNQCLSKYFQLRIAANAVPEAKIVALRFAACVKTEVIESA